MNDMNFDKCNNVLKPAQYYPALGAITGSARAMIFLSWLIDKTLCITAESRVAICWPADEIEKKTGLSPSEQVVARRELKSNGLMSEHRSRLTRDICFTLNVERLYELIEDKP